MIYLFHKIEDGHPGNENWNAPDQFRQLIEEKYAQIVSLSDYLLLGKKGIVITFDGVYESVYKNAFPILDQWHVPFELFVVWGTVGEDNAWDRKEPPARFATMSQLYQMASTEMGHIQSHTLRHRNLTDLSAVEMHKEIVNPLKRDFFAYPYGKFDARVEKAVMAQYRGAVSVNRGDNSQYQLLREFLK